MSLWPASRSPEDPGRSPPRRSTGTPRPSGSARAPTRGRATPRVLAPDLRAGAGSGRGLLDRPRSHQCDSRTGVFPDHGHVRQRRDRSVFAAGCPSRPAKVRRGRSRSCSRRSAPRSDLDDRALTGAGLTGSGCPSRRDRLADGEPGPDRPAAPGPTSRSSPSRDGRRERGTRFSRATSWLAMPVRARLPVRVRFLEADRENGTSPAVTLLLGPGEIETRRGRRSDAVRAHRSDRAARGGRRGTGPRRSLAPNGAVDDVGRDPRVSGRSDPSRALFDREHPAGSGGIRGGLARRSAQSGRARLPVVLRLGECLGNDRRRRPPWSFPGSSWVEVAHEGTAEEVTMVRASRVASLILRIGAGAGRIGGQIGRVPPARAGRPMSEIRKGSTTG